MIQKAFCRADKCIPGKESHSAEGISLPNVTVHFLHLASTIVDHVHMALNPG